jgi:hypothetical protein
MVPQWRLLLCTRPFGSIRRTRVSTDSLCTVQIQRAPWGSYGNAVYRELAKIIGKLSRQGRLGGAGRGYCFVAAVLGSVFARKAFASTTSARSVSAFFVSMTSF